MYAVVGGDGVVYGPVPVATLYEWIAQGRLTPMSQLIDGYGRRFPASMAPELQGAFPIAPQPYAFTPAPAFFTKRKSTALVWAFFLGFAGAHRFYLGHTSTGIAMLLLNVAAYAFGAKFDFAMAIFLGLIGTVWLIVDMIRIGTGTLKGADGQPLG